MTQPIGQPDHMIYRVSDMAAACRIWGELLGFEQIEVGEKWSEFSVGGITVALMLDSGGAEVPGFGPELVLRVEDLRVIVNRLVTSGMALIDAEREICSKEGHSYRYARISVPGGVLGLYQRIQSD